VAELAVMTAPVHIGDAALYQGDGLGAWREGFRFIGIEREAEYFTLAIHRLRAAQRQPDLFHEAGKAEARELAELEEAE